MHQSHHAGEIDEPMMNRLMQSLGYVLLHWSLLEHAFISDIRRLRTGEGNFSESSARVRGGFSEKLAEWRALMSLKTRRNPEAAQEVGELSTLAERLRRQRNLIAQHFMGATTDANEGEPALLVAEGGVGSLRSSQQVVTQSELDQLIAELDDCRSRISRLAAMVGS
ncbi:MAG TPA: hypothetical protein VGB54_09035 [Allosphingosinicella sp.]